MAKTDAINTDNPAGPSDLKLGDDYIRALARAVVEILAVDHYVGATNPYDSDAAGEHKQVLFNAPISKPATVAATKGELYLKTVAGKSELHWIDEDENEKQIMSVGKLNVVDADGAVVKTGDQTIAGIKTFSSSPIVPAPTTDMQASTKKYADDMLTTAKGIPASYAGEESVTLANGLIIKMGYKASVSTSTTVTFGTAFPTGIISVVVTPYGTPMTYSQHIISAQSVTAFTAIIDVAYTGFNWIAIGR